VFTRSSKRPALARVFWIHLLQVCWTFAGSCKHPITDYRGTDRRERPDSRNHTVLGHAETFKCKWNVKGF